MAVVTGANSGIGLETGAALAGLGAKTVLACRNQSRALTARADIVRRHAAADVEVLQLDLGDLAQIAGAAAEAKERFGRIDICVNNAGAIMRQRSVTVDGFETMFGVNHLGHFAWTTHLLPALLAAPESRIVNVTSLAHLKATMDWDDLMGERTFRPVAAYRRSKLANLLHVFELQRRLSRSEVSGAAGTTAVAAHPGISASAFWENGAGPRFAIAARVVNRCISTIFSSTAQGAVPVVYAATAPAIEPGRCYGPHIAQRWGRPGLVEPSPMACDPEAARRLWEVSEQLTGITVGL